MRPIGTVDCGRFELGQTQTHVVNLFDQGVQDAVMRLGERPLCESWVVDRHQVRSFVQRPLTALSGWTH